MLLLRLNWPCACDLGLRCKNEMQTKGCFQLVDSSSRSILLTALKLEQLAACSRRNTYTLLADCMSTFTNYQQRSQRSAALMACTTVVLQVHVPLLIGENPRLQSRTFFPGQRPPWHERSQHSSR